MLSGNLLYYFEAENSPKPQGIVTLEGALAQLAGQFQFKGQECIAVKTKTGRCFYFYGSKSENASWFEVIKSVPSVTALSVGAPNLTEGTSSASLGVSSPASPPSPGEGSSRNLVTLADLPEGKEGLVEPARALGVTDAVNALMGSLPPDVQVVWLSVLSAACKARETEDALKGSRASLAAAGQALEAQKAAAAELMKEAGDGPIAEKLKALVEGAAGAATLAGASDAYESGRADAEAALGKLRLEFNESLKTAVEQAERETEARKDTEFKTQLEAAVAAARAAERAETTAAQTAAGGSSAEWQTRMDEAVAAARTAAAAEKEDEINELLRRIAGLESQAKAAAESAGSASSEAELSAKLASCQGQLEQVGKQLELALVKAESGRQEIAGKDARVRQLETELTQVSAKLQKAMQDSAEEYVKSVKMDQEQKRLRERLDKMMAAEKYMGFQADEIMQAKANFLKMKDKAEAAAATAALLERELMSAREVARASEEAAGAREAAEGEARRAHEELARVAAEKAALEEKLRANAGATADADAAAQLEAALAAARTQASQAEKAAEAATQSASRLGKSLAAIVNTTREALQLNKDRAAMVAGDALDMFSFRDELRAGVEAAGKEAAARADAAAVFQRQSLEKKVRELEDSLKSAAEEKAGLEKELAESEHTEERVKSDLTVYMTKCREFELEKKTAEEKAERLDSRVHQLEMALAEAKAKLYNLTSPAAPDSVSKGPPPAPAE